MIRAWHHATDNVLFTVQMDDSFYTSYRKAFGFIVGNGTGGNTPGEALIEAKYCSSCGQ